MEKIVKSRYFPQSVLKIKYFILLTFFLWFLLSLPRSTGKDERKSSLLVLISQWLALVSCSPGLGFVSECFVDCLLVFTDCSDLGWPWRAETILEHWTVWLLFSLFWDILSWLKSAFPEENLGVGFRIRAVFLQGWKRLMLSAFYMGYSLWDCSNSLRSFSSSSSLSRRGQMWPSSLPGLLTQTWSLCSYSLMGQTWLRIWRPLYWFSLAATTNYYELVA